MKLCYIVYREDNVMIFDSQVLEYLQNLKKQSEIEEIVLVLFRHEQNLFRKEKVETKIHIFVDQCKTFCSFPVLSMTQLNLNVRRLKRYVMKHYAKMDQIAVICRGDLAAYLGVKAFKEFPNSRVLYDNRGLSIEESEMTYGNQLIHRINREKKRKALMYAKSHCDMYNFVTSPMRDFFIDKYGYDEQLPYTIIPTLYRSEEVDEEGLQVIKERENYSDHDYIVSYIGSTAAWQSTEQLVQLIKKLGSIAPQVRFFILTNGQIPELETLSEALKCRITVKAVPHCEIKYYLRLSNIGIIIRDNNIVNKVAAPTKIAEYLTNGIRILYSGDIGVITDLKNGAASTLLIDLGTDEEWVSKIEDDIRNSKKHVNEQITAFFDMDIKQNETITMFKKGFNNKKIG